MSLACALHLHSAFHLPYVIASQLEKLKSQDRGNSCNIQQTTQSPEPEENHVCFS